MSGELVASAVAAQLARTTTDVLRATTAASIVTIAREGPNPDLLGWLVQSTGDLVPDPSLVEGLAISHTLVGSWRSSFMDHGCSTKNNSTALARGPSC